MTTPIVNEELCGTNASTDIAQEHTTINPMLEIHAVLITPSGEVAAVDLVSSILTDGTPSAG